MTAMPSARPLEVRGPKAGTRGIRQSRHLIILPLAAVLAAVWVGCFAVDTQTGSRECEGFWDTPLLQGGCCNVEGGECRLDQGHSSGMSLAIVIVGGDGVSQIAGIEEKMMGVGSKRAYFVITRGICPSLDCRGSIQAKAGNIEYSFLLAQGVLMSLCVLASVHDYHECSNHIHF